MTLTHEELTQQQRNLVQMQFEHYCAHDFLSWQWWLLLVATVLPWVLWVFIRDRRKQYRLLFGAMIVGILSLVLDVVGTQYGWWRYQVKLVPSLPPLIPYDLTIMPVEYLLIQQMAKNHKRFCIYAALTAAFNSLIAENILKWMDVYKPMEWQVLYSLPIYFAVFYVATKAASPKQGWNELYES